MSKISKHRLEIQSLKEKDPEFFQFLQENDKQALNFGADNDDEEVDGAEAESDEGEDDECDDGDLDIVEFDDDDIEEDQDSKPSKSNKESDIKESVEITADMLEITFKQLQSGSYSNIRKVLSIFRCACIPSTDDDDDDDDDDDTASKAMQSRYKITSPDIYNEVMIKTLESLHVALKALFQQSSGSSTNSDSVYNFESADKHPKWKKFEALILSFFKSLLAIMANVHLTDIRDQSSAEVSVYLLTSLKNYILFLPCLPRMTRKLLKVLLTIWSEGPNPSEDQSNIRTHSFLRLHQMCNVLPGVTTEECYRSIYLTYARVSKSYNEINATSVHFMMECIVYLYSINPSQAYQQAFIYIRQIALHLRAVLMKKQADAGAKQLASWQVLNCVRLWTKVICAMPDESALGVLIFPLSQVIHGLLSTIQSNYFIPMKFHLIHCLHLLASAGKVFIPTAPKLYDFLDLAELSAKSTPSTETAPRLNYINKLPANSLSTQVVKDLIVTEIVSLLQIEGEIYKYNPGFPEYVYFIIKKLRAFSKATKVSKWRDLCRALASQLEDQSSWVKTARITSNISPILNHEIEVLLPPNTPPAFSRLAKMLANKHQDSIGYSSAHTLLDSASLSNSTSTQSLKGGSIERKKQSTKLKKSKPIKKRELENEHAVDNEVDPDMTGDRTKLNKIKSKVDANSDKRSKKSKPSKSSIQVEDEINNFSWSDDEEI